jgi:hypothetical protein
MSMGRKTKPRFVFVMLGSVALALLLSYFAYDYLVNEPQAKSERHILDVEMNKITVLPGSILLEHASTNKTQRTFVSQTFTTSASYETIREYYVQELTRLGWEYVKAAALDNPGKNAGTENVSFCKGSYTATLRYRSPNLSGSWRYAIDLGWWIRGCDPT